MVASDTRTRLVLTAMRLFWEKGYGSTSVADVLQAAKVNSGSLYHFFPGKQDLLLAVLDLYLQGIQTHAARAGLAGRGRSDRARLRPARAATASPSSTPSAVYGCPIGSLALELHEPDLPVRERLAANFTVWIEAIEECLHRGRRAPAGRLRSARARRLRAHHHGGRRDAGAHLPHDRELRRRGTAAARALRPAAARGRAREARAPPGHPQANQERR